MWVLPPDADTQGSMAGRRFGTNTATRGESRGGQAPPGPHSRLLGSRGGCVRSRQRLCAGEVGGGARAQGGPAAQQAIVSSRMKLLSHLQSAATSACCCSALVLCLLRKAGHNPCTHAPCLLWPGYPLTLWGWPAGWCQMWAWARPPSSLPPPCSGGPHGGRGTEGQGTPCPAALPHAACTEQARHKARFEARCMGAVKGTTHFER